MYTYTVTRAKVLKKAPLLDILISYSKTFRDKRDAKEIIAAAGCIVVVVVVDLAVVSTCPARSFAWNFTPHWLYMWGNWLRQQTGTWKKKKILNGLFDFRCISAGIAIFLSKRLEHYCNVRVLLFRLEHKFRLERLELISFFPCDNTTHTLMPIIIWRWRPFSGKSNVIAFPAYMVVGKIHGRFSADNNPNQVQHSPAAI